MVLEKRDLAKVIILSIVTCGIYGIYWYVVMGKDAVHVKDVNDDGTMEIVLLILLPFVGFYLAEKKFAEGCQSKGITHTDNSVLYLVLGLFGLSIVDAIMMQSELNKLADAQIDISGGTYYQQTPYQQDYNQQNPYQQNPYQQNPYQQNDAQQNPYDPNNNNGNQF